MKTRRKCKSLTGSKTVKHIAILKLSKGSKTFMSTHFFILGQDLALTIRSPSTTGNLKEGTFLYFSFMIASIFHPLKSGLTQFQPPFWNGPLVAPPGVFRFASNLQNDQNGLKNTCTKFHACITKMHDFVFSCTYPLDYNS